MEELYKLGISEITLKNMLEINPKIKKMTNQEIVAKKVLLEKVKCNDSQILCIISSNPLCLNRTNDEIIELINCLIKYGFRNLNVLFDSNPYILSLEPFEINNYINNRVDDGALLENIIDDLDSNPYLFSEI